MNTTTYTLSNQAISLLNAVESIADSGNRKAEKMLQKLFKRVQRRNKQAVQGATPASFVLADLFDVVSLEQDVPEHVIENDPMLEWVCCPVCDGEKWLEVEGNVWTKALFSDHRRAYAHRHLNSSYKVCGRCSGVGEVLDLATPQPIETTFHNPLPVLSTFDLLALAA
jgi:predicted methyltransferase MtxX (methanogen marker protein 4)